MRHELYFWREERPIELAEDSLLERLAENRNLPGVDRLASTTIKAVFSRYFPGPTVADDRIEYELADGSFQVSFSLDDLNQPTSICISSESPLVETPQIFELIIAAARELGCTRIESAFK
jgi:hypothetical protein